MAKCPGCDRELTGMEKLCRHCFEQRYARVAAGNTGPHRDSLLTAIVALLFFAALFTLFHYFPLATEQGLRIFGTSLLALKIVLACLVVLLSIYESLKWRSTQNLLFWMLAALNLAAAIMWFSTRQDRWLLPGILAFLIAKAWSNYQQKQAA